MKLSDLNPNEYTVVGSKVDQPTSSKIDRFGNAVGEYATDIVSGVGSEFGKAGFGAVEAGSKILGYGAEKLGMPSAAQAIRGFGQTAKQTSTELYEKSPVQENANTTLGTLGKFAADTAMFFAPSSQITRGQSILANLAGPMTKAPYGIGLATKIATRAVPEAAGAYATQYAISGGDKESSETMAKWAAGTTVALGALGGLARATYWPELEESTTKALGLQGKTTAGRVEPQIEKKVAGLSVLKKYAPQTKVMSEGIEETFDPSNATWQTTLQAWNQTRQNIFKKYDAISSSLGDSVVVDVSDLADDLNTVINATRTEGYKTAARTKLSDLVSNFAKQADDGSLVWRSATPKELEIYLKDLGKETEGVLAGTSDRISGEVAAGVAGKIRQKLDQTMLNATGAEYTNLRHEYSALLSIENDLVRKFQQEARTIGGGLSDYANIFSSGDLVAGLMGDTSSLARGATQGIVTTAMKFLKQPDRFLRRSFELIDKKPQGDVMNRLFGGAKQLTEKDKQMVDAVKQYLKEPKGGLSIQAVDGAGNPIKGVLNPKEMTQEPFKGLPDLSTKLVEAFKGEPNLISEGRFNEILNKTKNTGVKGVDEKMLMNSVVRENGKINLERTAQNVQDKLLPLTPKVLKQTRWENIGQKFHNKSKYGVEGEYHEVIYESPIKTQAGDIHFSNGSYEDGLVTQNYFSHVRYEDLADGNTRKIMETQSDLMQKENFAREQFRTGNRTDYKKVMPENVWNKYEKMMSEAPLTGQYSEMNKLEKQYEPKLQQLRKKEIEPLSAYSSNDPLAQLRTFREEVKRAAKDGKDTLLIPSGETAMKIEGLGESRIWVRLTPEGKIMGRGTDAHLTTGNMKVGQMVSPSPATDEWIITDVLGDGKFKAVPKKNWESMQNAKKAGGIYDDEFIERERLRTEETFDISGKVDTKHFVYKLNEEAIPREAKKMGLNVEGPIEQDNGKWWKIAIPKEQANMPVKAFGVVAPIGVATAIEKSKENDTVFNTRKSIISGKVFQAPTTKNKKGEDVTHPELSLPSEYEDAVVETSLHTNIPVSTIVKLLYQESKFDKEAEGTTGDYGLSQLTKPAIDTITGKSRGRNYFKDNYGEEFNLKDTTHQILAAGIYLNWLKQFGLPKSKTNPIKNPTTRDLLAAYNGGPDGLNYDYADTVLGITKK